MTFEEAKTLAAQMEAEVSALSSALSSFPSGTMGLTPDAVKFSPEFRVAKSAFDASFARQRKFLSIVTKVFKKEFAADRAARRGGC